MRNKGRGNFGFPQKKLNFRSCFKMLNSGKKSTQALSLAYGFHSSCPPQRTKINQDLSDFEDFQD